LLGNGAHRKRRKAAYNTTFAIHPEPAGMPSQPSKTLETFANPKSARDYLIHMEIPEFTCLCPKTGQPDFATLVLDYIPDRTCLELKSLKLYVWSFRNEGAFHEAVTNRILDDLAKATKPRFMRLTAKFYVRGGIFTTVVAERRKKGWKPQPRVELEDFPPPSAMR
jgi:7-cyano-7-deazaguanine reductase